MKLKRFTKKRVVFTVGFETWHLILSAFHVGWGRKIDIESFRMKKC